MSDPTPVIPDGNETASPRRGPDLRMAVVLFYLLFVCYAFVQQRRFDGPTAVSRLDLLHALFVHHTFRIDAYQHNTPDKALFHGHYYSDKAPGTVALAAPAFAVAAGCLWLLGIGLDTHAGWLVSSWVSCVSSLGLLTALGGAALYRWLRGRGIGVYAAAVTVLAIFLGAAPFPYATMMFSHALVVGLLSITLWAMDRQEGSVGTGFRTRRREEADPYETGGHRVRLLTSAAKEMGQWLRRHRWDLLAGLCAGWALASEYSSGLVVVGLFCWLGWRDWRRWLPFCVGAFGPLLLIPAYSWVCLHNPFTLPYSFQASFPAMRHGLYAIEWPDAVTAYNLLFSPTRGLFFWTPFLAMAWLGYFRKWEGSPALFWLTYAVPLLQIVVISGRVWDWQAGPTLGPRLLAPMLPLLALPAAYAAERFEKLATLLAIVSIGLTSFGTLVDATPSGNIYNPLIQWEWPQFLKGRISYNLFRLLGAPPLVSVALFYIALGTVFYWIWRRKRTQARPPSTIPNRKSQI